MTLFIIGIGLGDEKDITLRGLELVRSSDAVYLESYTSILQCKVKSLEGLYGKSIICADRTMVESGAESTILSDARSKKVAFLVVGDPMGATTHTDLVQRARRMGIKIEIIPNASVLTAVGATGLQLYKFGKVASIPFHTAELQADTFYKIIEDNQKMSAHTLILLDLDPSKERFMSAVEGIDFLLQAESRSNKGIFTKDSLFVVCARLGNPDQIIKAGKAETLKKADLGPAPHCIIVPSKMHFMEEEAIQEFLV